MNELYLIAHKVRGEPAFDIAQRLLIGDEKGWIIPTSGHRAYPYWADKLSVFCHGIEDIVPPCPEVWRDHYACNDLDLNNPNIDEYGDVIPLEDQAEGRGLFERLGFQHAPAPTVRRRI